MRYWWRSHSVRVRLTLWFVATMVVVLAVYAAAVSTVVRRTASQALDQQIRRDFQWVAATVYLSPDGTFGWSAPEEIVAEEDPLWVQVWGADGGALLFQNSEAERRPVPESRTLASRAERGIVTVPTDTAPMRILSPAARSGPTTGQLLAPSRLSSRWGAPKRPCGRSWGSFC